MSDGATKPVPTPIGQLIRYYRTHYPTVGEGPIKTRVMTLRETAARAGIHHNTIYQWEHGIIELGVFRRLFAVAGVLHIPIEEMFAAIETTVLGVEDEGGT